MRAVRTFAERCEQSKPGAARTAAAAAVLAALRSPQGCQGATDPDEWTVVTQSEADDDKRFDCGAGEFILRLLTDVQLGYPMSHASGHYFVSYGPLHS